MNPKEKAKELVDKFYYDKVRASVRGKILNAKYNALICVEEIIDCYDFEGIYGMSKDPDWYWNEVKTEIKKL